MAYSRYATQFTDKNGNVYGVMDEEARSHLAIVEGGYNPEMVVGGAEHLVSKDGVVDTALYGLRRVPDRAGQAYLEKVVGGTVAWNQFMPELYQSGTQSNITITNNGDGSLTLNGTAASAATVQLDNSIFPFPINHVFVTGLGTDIPSTSYLSISGIRVAANGSDYGMWKNTQYEVGLHLRIDYANGTVFNNLKVWPQVFDLTQMFGPTIADAIYAMEQATAGAGVAWFRKLFSASYYPFNAGELISVNARWHRTVGLNQWDEEWELGGFEANGTKDAMQDRIRSGNFIPCIPGQTYYIKQGDLSDSTWSYFVFYDENREVIGSRVTVFGNVEAPSSARYMKFNMNPSYGALYNHDVCISLSSDRNGEYEPYSAYTYPFSDLTLRGIPKLENGELGYDGDTYLPDGTVTRRFGMVDLGTRGWVYTSGEHSRFTSTFTPVKPTGDASIVALCICSKYATDSVANIYVHSKDKTIGIHNSDHQIWIYDSAYSDAAAFQTSLSGVYLVYELATPTTEQADPFNPFQILDPYGTEEFISGTVVLVGHSTRYQADMVKTMQKEIDAALICPTASGAIASFADGADGLKLRELNVAVEPVQDLHGYNAPWPGGGGKNLLKPRAAWSTTASGVTIAFADNGVITLNGTATQSSVQNVSGSSVEENKLYLPAGTYVVSAELFGDSECFIGVNVNSTSGAYTASSRGTPTSTLPNTFTVSDGDYIYVRVRVYEGVTFNNAVVHPMIRPVSISDTTWAPYSNICPIFGHMGAVVTRTGVNVWDEEWEEGLYSNVNGEKVSYAGKIRSKNHIPCVQNTAYYFKYTGSISGIKARICYYDKEKTFISCDNDKLFNAPYTTPANACYMSICTINATVSTYTNDISVNYPSTDHDYHPGSVLSVTIPFGQTVYGGNLTLHQDGSGELVVNMASVDLGTINWYDTADAHVFRGYVALKAPGIGNFLCQNYVWSGTAATAGNCTMCGVASSPNVYIRDDAYSDAAAFKTAMSGVQLVYELATPVTISLSASQITTLLGHNNIFADCGDVSVTYPADTKLYVDGQQTEDDMTANANIPNGNYFQVGNTLYKATAAIAQGEAIAPGTNCTKTTFAEALNLLAAQ